MLEKIEDLKKYVPTNDELQGIIDKLRDILVALAGLFDEMREKLSMNFGKYSPTY
jgi:hypothetical protein